MLILSVTKKGIFMTQETNQDTASVQDMIARNDERFVASLPKSDQSVKVGGTLSFRWCGRQQVMKTSPDLTEALLRLRLVTRLNGKLYPTRGCTERLTKFLYSEAVNAVVSDSATYPRVALESNVEDAYNDWATYHKKLGFMR